MGSKFFKSSKVTALLLTISLILAVPVSADNSQVGYKSTIVEQNVQELNVVEGETSVDLDFSKKGLEIKNIIDGQGKKYKINGKYTTKIDGLDSNSFYVFVIDGKKNDTDERVFVFAKTKDKSNARAGISHYVVDNSGIEISWEGAGQEYLVFKNGVELSKTKETHFRGELGQGETQYSILSKEISDSGEELINNWQITVNASKLAAMDTTVMAAASYVPWAKIRLMGFINEGFIPAADDALGDGYTEYFEGDSRSYGYSYGDSTSLTPQYRFLQDVFVDFTNNSQNYKENVGRSTRFYINNTTNQRDYSKDVHGYASMSGMSVQNFVWSTNKVSFNVVTSAGNPLTPSPNADANLNFTLYRGIYGACGLTEIKGSHDGYPTYEIYRNEGSNGTWSLYQFAHQSLASLAPPAEITVDASV